MTKSNHFHEHRNLSVAWASAVQATISRGVKEMAPLIVSFTGFDDKGNFEEDGTIKQALENILKTRGKQTINTVANTIFPASMWNPSLDRGHLFDRYGSIIHKLKKASPQNRRGLYFARMIAGGARSASQ